MSIAYYIALNVEEPDFDTYVNGKAVADVMDEIDALCESEGLPLLRDFMGQGIDEFKDLLNEELDLPEDDDGEEIWFEPADGIALFEALITHIKASPEVLGDSEENAEAVIADLEAYAEVLRQAESIAAQWHLAMDI